MSPTLHGDHRDVPEFDGANEKFSMWKTQMILYLKKRKLLGYIIIDGYDGTQAFLYDEEMFPANVKAKESKETAEAVPPGVEEGEREKKSKKKKKSGIAQGVEGDEDDDDRSRVISQRADVALILMKGIAPTYHALMGDAKSPFVMWKNVVEHFGSRGPTEYAKFYAQVFENKLNLEKDAGVFVYELDAAILEFEKVINMKVSNLFKALILQHALPKSWAMTVKTWLGTDKVLEYDRLKGLVTEESRKHRASNEQSSEETGVKRKAETAYHVREAQPHGAKVQRTGKHCFYCGETDHIVMACETKRADAAKGVYRRCLPHLKPTSGHQNPTQSQMTGRELGRLKEEIIRELRESGQGENRNNTRPRSPPPYDRGGYYGPQVGRERSPVRGRNQSPPRGRNQSPPRDQRERTNDNRGRPFEGRPFDNRDRRWDNREYRSDDRGRGSPPRGSQPMRQRSPEKRRSIPRGREGSPYFPRPQSPRRERSGDRGNNREVARYAHVIIPGSESNNALSDGTKSC
jgi:hypothetical protein